IEATFEAGDFLGLIGLASAATWATWMVGGARAIGLPAGRGHPLAETFPNVSLAIALLILVAGPALALVETGFANPVAAEVMQASPGGVSGGLTNVVTVSSVLPAVTLLVPLLIFGAIVYAAAGTSTIRTQARPARAGVGRASGGGGRGRGRLSDRRPGRVGSSRRGRARRGYGPAGRRTAGLGDPPRRVHAATGALHRGRPGGALGRARSDVGRWREPSLRGDLDDRFRGGARPLEPRPVRGAVCPGADLTGRGGRRGPCGSRLRRGAVRRRGRDRRGIGMDPHQGPQFSLRRSSSSLSRSRRWSSCLPSPRSGPPAVPCLPKAAREWPAPRPWSPRRRSTSRFSSCSRWPCSTPRSRAGAASRHGCGFPCSPWRCWHWRRSSRGAEASLS